MVCPRIVVYEVWSDIFIFGSVNNALPIAMRALYKNLHYPGTGSSNPDFSLMQKRIGMKQEVQL